MTNNIEEPTYDGNEILDPFDLIKAQSTDAKLWAKSFIDAMDENDWQLYDIDEGLMTSWFATVIETTKDRIHNDNNKLIVKEVHDGYTDNKYKILWDEANSYEVGDKIIVDGKECVIISDSVDTPIEDE